MSWYVKASVTLAFIALTFFAHASEIHTAAMRGDIKRILTLLNSEPDLISAVDTQGWLPLHCAAANGKSAAVSVILDKGANANSIARGVTALHVAATNGDLPTVTVLVKGGANVNATNSLFETPLCLALRSGNAEVAELLRNSGAWENSSFEIRLKKTNALFTQESRRCLRLLRLSNYPSSQCIIIIQEPHGSLKKHLALLHGLEAFFDANPSLKTNSVFLAEGAKAFEEVSVAPLLAVEPHPSEKLLKRVLSSYLITGYLGFEWKHQLGIKTFGTEDDKLYQFCVNSLLAKNNSSPASYFSYVARNQSISKVVLTYAEKIENPVLFVGGAHVFNEGELAVQIFGQRVESSFDGTVATTIAKELEQHRIGFAYFEAEGGDIDAFNERYLRLFRAQKQNDYMNYIDEIVGRKIQK